MSEHLQRKGGGDGENSDVRASQGQSKADRASHLFVFTNNKAGMDSVDQKNMKKVVYEMSKDSAFFKNAEGKAANVSKRIEKLKRKIELVRNTPPLAAAAKETFVSRIRGQLEAQRDNSSTWICVDMDMFYAAVELRDNPELRGKPVAVGGMSMISTSNYEARKFGVRSAMPGFIAKELCPDLIFVKSNFAKYRQVARQIREIFNEYDPDFMSWSLDEAFLNITDYLDKQTHDYNNALLQNKTDVKLPQTGTEVAAEVRARIFRTTQLTASAGIAPTRILAKICSDMNKPNGQFCLPNTTAATLDFMKSLSVRKIPGIGKVMERILNELNIKTCGQVWEIDNAYMLAQVFSQNTSRWLLRSCLGIPSSDDDHHQVSGFGIVPKRKSVSNERTFRPTSDVTWLRNKCKDLAEKLAEDMDRHDIKGKHITLKLKSSDFDVQTKAMQLTRYIHTAEDIAHFALHILDEVLEACRRATPPTKLKLRLMGIRVATLQHRTFRGSAQGNDLTSYFGKQHVLPKRPASSKNPAPSQGKPSRLSQLQQSVTQSGALSPSLDPHSILPSKRPSQSQKVAAPTPSKRAKKPTIDTFFGVSSEPVPASSSSTAPSKLKGVRTLSSLLATQTRLACPVCQCLVEAKHINRHVDACLAHQDAQQSAARKVASKCKITGYFGLS